MDREERSSNSVRLPMSMLLVARRFHLTFDDEMTVAPMDHSPKRKWWRHRVAVLKRRTGSVRVVERLLSVFVGGSVMLGMISAGATSAQAASLPATPVLAEVSAEERVAGLWYADRLRFDELAAQGATGEGIKIAVIDAAINPAAAELQGANVKVTGSYCVFRDTGKPVPATSTDLERASHGTSVVSMLVGNGVAADGGLGTRGIVPDAEVMFYSTGLPEDQYQPDGPGCEEYDVESKEFLEDKNLMPDDPDYYFGGPDAYAAWQAIDDGADIIVYSIISGDIYGWIPTLEKALRAGVPVVAGTPNPDGVLDKNYYPYSLNGAVAVSGVDHEGKLLNGGGNVTGDTFRGDAIGSSNLGFVSAASYLLSPSNKSGWGPTVSSGTSLATPLVAGTLAIGMQKFPDATANQVLQAMIRTTGNAGIHEPDWVGNQWGYGIANPTSLLTAYPLDYPDENPLFAFDLDDPRCIFAEEGKVGDWEGMIGMEGCAWAIAPTGQEVWPNGRNGDLESTEPTSGDTRQEATLPPIVWIIGGVVLLGVIAAAITVPVVVARSRKRHSE